MIRCARESRSQAAALAAVAIALAAGPAKSAEPLDVSIACRDGAPNGAYEIRGANGRLRVAGAFSKGRRTGTFIFWNARGARVAVIPYENEQKVGTLAAWYASRGSGIEGLRKLEAPYAAGRRHGVTRSWHDNGRPRAEVRYEQGALVEARAWRRGGAQMTEREARAQAERDAVADDALFAELESLVAKNLPACEPNVPHGSASELPDESKRRAVGLAAAL